MAITAKFVVITPENAAWIKQQATEMYHVFFSNFPQETETYINSNFSQEKLIWGQNDFSIEMLMSYDDEIPLAFAQINSSWHANRHIEGHRPICIQHLVHNDAGLSEILEKAEQVALQRKHGLIWINVPEKDVTLTNLVMSKGYDKFSLDGQDPLLNGVISFKKILLPL